ncbi:MAG TPA: response regulator [Gammaproteobacteria bacterium]|nr:response regulator [Gammaproteobacteria bacterium]
MHSTEMRNTRPIRTLIVDDEPLARAGLRKFCDQEPDLEIVAECDDGSSAVQTIEHERPDLVFLDIQMQEMSGFDVLTQLAPDTLPYIVFTTAHDAYAVDAYEFEAVDFLLKPFDRSRFEKSLARVRSRLDSATPEKLRSQLAAAMRLIGVDETHAAPRQYLQRIAVRHGQRTTFIPTHEIGCIEARRNYVDLHVGKERYALHATMKALEEKLDRTRFLRIHRSVLVNVDQVAEIQNWFNGCFRFMLAGGATFTSGRGYRKAIVSFLNNELA